MIAFYLGGARSGKSRLAELAAQNTGKQLVYIATAQAGDDEMASRIAHHQQQRGSHWTVIEESRDLVGAIAQFSGDNICMLIDCLTLWLSNCLLSEPSAEQIESERQALVNALQQAAGDIILVSNEVGQGIVPANALARRFIDESGRLNQAIAAISHRVNSVVAGIPQLIKEI